MPFFRRGKRGEEEQPKEPARGAEEARRDEPAPPQPPPLSLPPSPTVPELAAGRYASSGEHLWDELRRIDQLVRAETVRWRRTLAANKPAHLWGMVSVSEEEVSAYLNSPFVPHGEATGEPDSSIESHRHAAQSLAESIRARLEETPPEVELRLPALQNLFGLSDFERDALLVCLLPEADGRYRRLFGYLQDDVSRVNPSVELVRNILRHGVETEAALDAFAADSPLVAHRLVMLSGDAESAEPLPARGVRSDDRVADFLAGRDGMDARLVGIVRESGEAVSFDGLLVEPERRERLAALAAHWNDLREAGRGPLTVFLHGPYGGGRLAAARAVCAAASSPLLVADAAALTRSPLDADLVITLAFREARLGGAALFWSHCETLVEDARLKSVWDALVGAAEHSDGLVFLASEAAWEPAARFRESEYTRFEFPVPGFELRRAIWAARLPPPSELDESAPDRVALAEQLANGFQLTEGQVEDALVTAREQAIARDPRAPRVTAEDLFEGCRRQSNQRLSAFARRIEPRAGLTFDDLVLPPPNRRQLDELRFRISQRHCVRAQFKNRLTLGRGLIALFTGSSGTGKTMAAGLLAEEQGVNLYKVDLSAVVSKYVGETEKNLSHVFTEAEDANAIIFFDEGEALFGQRGSKTETGQDRWANMEVNFLLQRVEEYTGVVIIASNLRQNIDEAFVRRIHVVVEFPFPEEEGRRRIWTGLFPPGVERPSDEEVADLARRFRLSGGSISNVVVDAAFRALAEAEGREPQITARHLALGIAREYQKMGRPVTRGEFGDTFYRFVERDILLSAPQG